MTFSQAKVTLRVVGPSRQSTHKNLGVSSSKSTPTFLKTRYNLLDHLQQTPSQISIFELFELSLIHQEILEKYLLMKNIPKYLDFDKVQNW